MIVVHSWLVPYLLLFIELLNSIPSPKISLHAPGRVIQACTARQQKCLSGCGSQSIVSEENPTGVIGSGHLKGLPGPAEPSVCQAYDRRTSEPNSWSPPRLMATSRSGWCRLRFSGRMPGSFVNICKTTSSSLPLNCPETDCA